MAASYVAFGAVASGQTSVAPAYPSGVAAGDLVTMIVVNKPDTVTPTTPTGWTRLYTGTGGTGSLGGGTGLVRGTVFVREATGTLTGSQTVTVTSGDSASASMVLWRKLSTENWVYAASSGNRSTSATAWTSTLASVIPFTTDDQYLLAYGRSANTTATAEAITATGATFSAATERVDTGTTVGNDISLAVATGSVTAGTATAAAVMTATMAAATYGVGLAVQIDTVPAPPGKVSGLTAVGDSGRVDLTWTAQANTTSYTVYRNGTALSTTVTGTSFSDITGLADVAYSYTVAAVNAAGTGTVSDAATAASSAPIIPGMPSGLYFRFRVDNAAANYMTTNTAGGIVDSSGYSRPNAIPGTTAIRPALIAGGVKGHSYLAFDGVDDRLTTSQSGNPTMLAIGNNKPGITFVAFVKINPESIDGTTKTLFFNSIFNSNSTRIALNIHANGSWSLDGRRLDGDAVYNLQGPAVDTNLHMLVAVNDYIGQKQDLYIDGVLVATRTSFTASGNSSATNSLGWNWGSNNTPAQWVNANYYELMGFDRALDSSDVAMLKTYYDTEYSTARSGWYAMINGVEVPAAVRSI